MYKKTYALDGNEYDSAQEARIADWLYTHGIKFEAHKKLPPPSKQNADFFLPDFGPLWLEWDGLMEVRATSSCDADKRMSRKDAFYEKHGLKHLTITRDNWEQKLYEVLMSN